MLSAKQDATIHKLNDGPATLNESVKIQHQKSLNANCCLRPTQLLTHERSLRGQRIRSRQDHDAGAQIHPAIEVFNILVGQANAAG